MSVDARLQELGWQLPQAPRPVANYLPAVTVNGLIYTAGVLPLVQGRLAVTGKVGKDLTLAEAQEQARVALLNALAVVRQEAGSLDRVARIVRLTGYVNSAPGFTDQPLVLNAASDRLVELFGEIGRHTRCAIGAAELPLNAPVELDLIVALQS
jgi:enamine deaminase RidA (YjgF/YER057c/UK114 family)